MSVFEVSFALNSWYLTAMSHALAFWISIASFVGSAAEGVPNSAGGTNVVSIFRGALCGNFGFLNMLLYWSSRGMTSVVVGCPAELFRAFFLESCHGLGLEYSCRFG